MSPHTENLFQPKLSLRQLTNLATKARDPAHQDTLVAANAHARATTLLIAHTAPHAASTTTPASADDLDTQLRINAQLARLLANLAYQPRHKPKIAPAAPALLAAAHVALAACGPEARDARRALAPSEPLSGCVSLLLEATAALANLANGNELRASTWGSDSELVQLLLRLVEMRADVASEAVRALSNLMCEPQTHRRVYSPRFPELLAARLESALEVLSEVGGGGAESVGGCSRAHALAKECQMLGRAPPAPAWLVALPSSAGELVDACMRSDAKLREGSRGVGSSAAVPVAARAQSSTSSHRQVELVLAERCVSAFATLAGRTEAAVDCAELPSLMRTLVGILLLDGDSAVAAAASTSSHAATPAPPSAPYESHSTTRQWLLTSTTEVEPTALAVRVASTISRIALADAAFAVRGLQQGLLPALTALLRGWRFEGGGHGAAGDDSARLNALSDLVEVIQHGVMHHSVARSMLLCSSWAPALLLALHLASTRLPSPPPSSPTAPPVVMVARSVSELASSLEAWRPGLYTEVVEGGAAALWGHQGVADTSAEATLLAAAALCLLATSPLGCSAAARSSAFPCLVSLLTPSGDGDASLALLAALALRRVLQSACEAAVPLALAGAVPLLISLLSAAELRPPALRHQLMMLLFEMGANSELQLHCLQHGVLSLVVDALLEPRAGGRSAHEACHLSSFLSAAAIAAAALVSPAHSLLPLLAQGEVCAALQLAHGGPRSSHEPSLGLAPEACRDRLAKHCLRHSWMLEARLPPVGDDDDGKEDRLPGEPGGEPELLQLYALLLIARFPPHAQRPEPVGNAEGAESRLDDEYAVEMPRGIQLRLLLRSCFAAARQPTERRRRHACACVVDHLLETAVRRSHGVAPLGLSAARSLVSALAHEWPRTPTADRIAGLDAAHLIVGQLEVALGNA